MLWDAHTARVAGDTAEFLTLVQTFSVILGQIKQLSTVPWETPQKQHKSFCTGLSGQHAPLLRKRLNHCADGASSTPGSSSTT